MKKQLSKCFLLYGSLLLILKLYLTGLFPAALFMDWKTCSQSLLLVFIFFDVKLFKFFLVFKFLNFLICLRQMIFFRTKHYKLLIWLGGVIFSLLLICIDFLFLFPEFKYLVYLFFDLLFRFTIYMYVYWISNFNIKQKQYTSFLHWIRIIYHCQSNFKQFLFCFLNRY